MAKQQDPKMEFKQFKKNKLTCDSKYMNDVKWYKQNPAIAELAGRLSFNNILGLTSDTKFMGDESLNRKFNDQEAFPGIMVIGYTPTVGLSTDERSAVNIAARQIYSYVRHANSGSRNYEAPDLMMYLLALGSAYQEYSELVRVYGMLNTYSITNRYVGKALVEAAGFNYDDLTANRNLLCSAINQFAVKLNTFAVPKDLYYYDRVSWLPLNVFKDSTLDKSQLYMFRPVGYYTWDGYTEQTGTSLRFHRINLDLESLRTYEDILEMINTITQSLLLIEDVGIISGDILKAFGNNIHSLPGISETEVTVPGYDEGVLSQIHNLTVVGKVTDDTINIIQDEEGNIIYNPSVGSNKPENLLCINPIIDSGMVDPTSDFVLEATRLTSIPAAKSELAGTYTLATFGTELVQSLIIHKYSNGELTTIGIGTSLTAVDNVGLDAIVIRLSELSKFDWHPFVNVINIDTGVETSPEEAGYWTYTYGDIFNYTRIDEAPLRNIHDCCLQSLFNVYGIYTKGI